ncbi:MAG: hypothetical protein J6J36_07125 [Clostridia bacterium]|nr:hypothetical protein [Clostridia bacterium]
MSIPVDYHALGNMIYNLEGRKGLKEVIFTQSAVKEVLTYLKLLEEEVNKERLEEKKYYDNLYNSKGALEGKANICSICGKQYEGMGNDIRPLVTSRGNRCCDKCNMDIVIPNRMKFWEAEYWYVIKDTRDNYYVDHTGLSNSAVSLLSDYIPKFLTYEDAEKHIRLNKLKYCTPVRILIREDN